VPTLIGHLLLLVLCAGYFSAAHGKASSNATDIIELTIDKAHAAFREKRLTCRQLVEHYITRIKTYDQPEHLNAIIYINPNATKRAMELDSKFNTTGTLRRLHCVPVIVKDNIATQGIPTEAGSKALKGFIPKKDARIISLLRAEDAIILAKSNMDEWAFSPYHTISSTHGETRNAYDRDIVPGGSSGGTASAIAANLGLVGLGTSTGSSVRGPAAHSSLVGLRPTLGRVSNKGIVPLLRNRDIAGPMTRTVKDAAIVFSVIQNTSFETSPVLYADLAGLFKKFDQPVTKTLQGVRLGVARQVYDTPTADFEVMEIMDRAIADLKKAGAVIVDSFEIEDYRSLSQQAVFCSRMYFDLGNFLATTDGNPPIHGFNDVVKKKNYLAHNQNFIDWVMKQTGHPAKQQPPCSDVNGDPRRKRLRDAVSRAMNKYAVDAIIYPSWSNPAREIGDMQTPHGDNNQGISPHTGQPAITVPMGFTEAGLPLGLQLLSRQNDDHKLLLYANAYEKLTRHRKPPGGYGAGDE
jgi:Asp-tRNA(Asn)/Glu-tRNA(Gln) amidotransferase A subunit family amidase